METTTKTLTKKEILPEEKSLEPSIAQSVPAVKQDFDIDGFLEKRKEFITKVNRIMVEGKDYHVIQGKKSLAKGGAEKIASIFGWTAKFAQDNETYNMLKPGIRDAFVAYVCWLSKPHEDQFHTLGQGRGVAVLSKNSGDPNKTVKMAQKSAFIDAVLRASGLSDFFTQDLEDHPEHLNDYHNSRPQSTEPEKMKMSEKQMNFIGKLCKEKNVSKDELKVIIKDHNFKYASELIDYLLGMPVQAPQQELPTIQQEESTAQQIAKELEY